MQPNLKKPFLGALIVCAAAYLAYPYYAVYRLETGLQTDDRDILENHVSWISLRENMKEELRILSPADVQVDGGKINELLWRKLVFGTPTMRTERTGDTTKIEIYGHINNPTSKNIPTPEVEGILKNTEGRAVRSWKFKPKAPVIPANSKILFLTSIVDPPKDAKKLTMRVSNFANSAEKLEDKILSMLRPWLTAAAIDAIVSPTGLQRLLEDGNIKPIDREAKEKAPAAKQIASGATGGAGFRDRMEYAFFANPTKFRVEIKTNDIKN